MPYWVAVRECLPHIAGDGLVAIVAFWAAAALERTRRWIATPRWRGTAAFVLTGLFVSVAVEWHALAVGRWAYAPPMPMIPGLGVGLMPLLQWAVLPPLVVWLVRRQLT